MSSAIITIFSSDTQRRDSISPGLVPEPACVSFTTWQASLRMVLMF